MSFFRSGFFRTAAGVIAGFAVLLILFVTAFEAACYIDYGFYQKEYEKYDVNNEASIINMSMQELMDVTKEMMAYLHGEREDLVIYAEIDGEEKLMFNQTDQKHMADVRELFLAGMEKRRICMGILVICLLLLLLNAGVRQGIIDFANGIMISFLMMLVAVSGVVLAAVINFRAVFYAMHHLLFDNDGWLLDPNVSRLINMLPEGFFADMGIRIAVIFIFMIICIFILSFCIKCGMIKKTMKTAHSVVENK